MGGTPAPKVSKVSPKSAERPVTAQVGLMAQSNQALVRTQMQGKLGSAESSAPQQSTSVPGRYVKLPPLSVKQREEMAGDVERIVKILKSSTFTGALDAADQTLVLDRIRKYEKADQDAPSVNGKKGTPLLDHFLILLKSRAFSRSSIRSFFVDQYAIAYDALWYQLRGYWLEEFKRVVALSQTQGTNGPSDKDVENGVALLAKQEAMGMWGMLKGLGTGMVGIAGPKAAGAMAAQFDEAAEILFGHEWGSAEPLVWGMNAGQIGTVGGDVIWQLVAFARGAGPAKAGRIMAIVEQLKKIAAIAGGLQGVAMAASGIARVIEKHQKAGNQITWDLLINDPDFIDQLVSLVSSSISTVMAGKAPPAGKADGVTRARIQLLLSKLHLVAGANRWASIAASDKSEHEKRLEYGQLLTNLIPQLFASGMDAHAVATAMRQPKQIETPAQPDSRQPPIASENDPVAAKVVPQSSTSIEKDSLPQSGPPRKAPRDKADSQQGNNGKSMFEPVPVKRPVASKNEQIDAARQIIAEAHEAAMVDEVKNQLAPRRAVPLNEDIATGRRTPAFEIPKRGSATIGEPHPTLSAAQAVYDQVIAGTGGRNEVGIWQHPDTGQYVVQLGQGTSVGQPSGDIPWRAVQHYHPNLSDVPLWRMPAGADVAELCSRVAGQGRTMTEIVEYPLPEGMRGRVAYTVTAKGQLAVEFIDADGSRRQKIFNKVSDYDSYHPSRKIHVNPTVIADVELWLADRRKVAGAEDALAGEKTMMRPAPAKSAQKPDQKKAAGGDGMRAKDSVLMTQQQVMQPVVDVSSDRVADIAPINGLGISAPKKANKTIGKPQASKKWPIQDTHPESMGQQAVMQPVVDISSDRVADIAPVNGLGITAPKKANKTIGKPQASQKKPLQDSHFEGLQPSVVNSAISPMEASAEIKKSSGEKTDAAVLTGKEKKLAEKSLSLRAAAEAKERQNNAISKEALAEREVSDFPSESVRQLRLEQEKLANLKARNLSAPPELRKELQRIELEEEPSVLKGDSEPMVKRLTELAKRSDLSPEAKAYLEWKMELAEARAEVADVGGGGFENAVLKGKANTSKERDAADAALRSALRPVGDILRDGKGGPNYREKIGAKWDEFMKSPVAASEVDHLFPIAKIKSSPEMARLLEIYDALSPANKRRVVEELERLGDLKSNLFSIKEEVNQFKKDFLWEEIGLEKAKQFGYSKEQYDNMVAQQRLQGELILGRLRAFVEALGR